MNFLSIAHKVTMNPNNGNTEALRLLKELHITRVFQCEKQLLILIAYMKYFVKYTNFFNYTGSSISINVISIFITLASLRRC